MRSMASNRWLMASVCWASWSWHWNCSRACCCAFSISVRLSELEAMLRSAVDARSLIVAAADALSPPGTEMLAPTAGMVCCAAASVLTLGTETEVTLRADGPPGTTGLTGTTFGRDTPPIECPTDSVVVTERVSATSTLVAA